MPAAALLKRIRSEVGRRAVARSQLARRVSFRARWSSTRRLEPLSEWGFERGVPVDRWYIQRFLDEHRHLVSGHALEVKEDLYATRLGAQRVDILDVDPANRVATIVGDMCDPQTLPVETFDVAVVTQTLQLLPDPRQALVNLRECLRPGGVLLVTVPCMSRLAGEWDRWRWTPRGFEDVVRSAGALGELHAVGNLLTCRAFLLGAAADDIDAELMAVHDPDYPLLVAAVLR